MKFRPEADIFPLMSDAELRALAEDIDRQGQLEPILLLGGDILDGRNRYLAITQYCATRTAEMKEVAPDDPVAFVVGLNLKRRHLNESQRAMVAARVATLQRGRPKENASIEAFSTQSQAADLLSVGKASVQRAKRVQTKGSKKLNEAVDQGQLSLGKAEQITKQYPDKAKQDAVVRDVAKSQMANRVKGLTGEIEWYTPRTYIEAAAKVMGGIDLDPASSEDAQRHVQARNYYTIEQDGLTQRWHGSVFLNPPYKMPLVKHFVTKMAESWQQHHITQGILLTNNATDTEWFHLALNVATAVCLTRGRIHFLEVRDGELLQKNSPTCGQSFFYFGNEPDRFADVFTEFGSIVVPSSRHGLMIQWAATVRRHLAG